MNNLILYHSWTSLKFVHIFEREKLLIIQKFVLNYEEEYTLEGRLKNETLYYIDVIGMTWEQCKSKYLNEVGR